MPPTDTEYRQNRQQEILRLLHEGARISSQEQFVELLHARGIPATQSSISRDLRDLGVYRYGGFYALPMTLKIDSATVQRDLEYRASLFLLRIQSAGPHLLVVITEPGGAQSMAIAIENMKWGEVIGTIAGDDTIFLAVPGREEQRRVFDRLMKLLPER